MAGTARPTGNLIDTLERHSKDIRKLRAKLASQTPADVSHDHDADYSSLTHNHDSDYLQLSGGTMSGTINMGANAIQGVYGIYADATLDDLTFRNNAGTTKFMYDSSIDSFRVLAAGAMRVSDEVVFEADTNTGFKRITADVAALRAGGVDVFRWRNTAQTFYSGTDSSWSGFTAIERVALHGQDGIIHACRGGGESLFLGRNDSDGSIVRFDRSGSQVGSISVTTTSTAYNTSSDENLKTNIADSDTTAILSKVRSIKVRDFDWIENNKHETGLVAQEVAAIYPDAVTPPQAANKSVESGSDHWMIDYSKMVPLLLGAVQEQQNQIDALQAEISALTS